MTLQTYLDRYDAALAAGKKGLAAAIARGVPARFAEAFAEATYQPEEGDPRDEYYLERLYDAYEERQLNRLDAMRNGDF